MYVCVSKYIAFPMLSRNPRRCAAPMVASPQRRTRNALARRCRLKGKGSKYLSDPGLLAKRPAARGPEHL